MITTIIELFFSVFGVFPFFHTDRDLRLERKMTREIKDFKKWKQIKMFSPLFNSAVEHVFLLHWS